MKRVFPQPVPQDKGPWRWLLSLLPGFCSYCGKKYIACNQGIDTFTFMPKNGRCCPDGHEGYVDRFIVSGDIARYTFDYVAHPPADPS